MYHRAVATELVQTCLDHFGKPASVLAALCFAAVLGCSTPSAPADAPPDASPTMSGTADGDRGAAPDVKGGRFERFVWTDFHFEMGGTQVFDVSGRRVRDLFHDSRKTTIQGQPAIQMFFRLAEYDLTDAELASLERAVAAPSYWALQPRYEEPDIEDGSTQTFTVWLDTGKKDVVCYHQWPEPVRAMRDLVAAIQKGHEAERKAAAEVDPKVAEQIRSEAAAAGRAAGRTSK